MEARLVPQTGLPLELIRVAGLKGISGTKFLRNAAMLPAGLWDSERILRRHKINLALGVGGYASGPMMLLAAMHRIPTVVFEPNVEPGFTNRVLSRIATRIAVANQETAGRLGANAVLTGCPIRKEFFTVPRKEHREPFTLLITGGSRGAFRSTAPSSLRWTTLPLEKASFSSCIRLANTTIMRCEQRMHHARFRRRSSPSSKIWRRGLPRPT